MKISSPVLLALLLACALLSGCSSETSEPAQSKPVRTPVVQVPKGLQQNTPPRVLPTDNTPVDGPLIEFQELHRDFGQVPDTENLVHQFRFENVGSGTLMIQDIKPSCGCTTTTLERTQYGPGEGGSIDVDWAPKGHGKQSKTITVRSNSKRTPILQLRISAEIQPFLVVTPPRAEFNLYKRGSGRELLLSVSCSDPEMEILELKGTTPDLAVELVAPAVDGRAQIRVSIKEEREYKGVRRFFPKILVKARARVQGQAFPIEHTHEIPVLATIYDELAPDPAFFGVGRIPPGRTLSKELVVTRPSGEPFAITGFELSGFLPAEGSSVKIDPVTTGGQTGYKVTLTCSLGSYEGPVRGQVLLETDLASEPTMRLDVFGVSGAAKPK